MKTFKDEVTKECENILAFWEKNCVDEANGGFIGSIDSDMTKHPEAEKGSVLNARILYTYSSAYYLFKKPEYLALANNAYEYSIAHFLNKNNYGIYWMLDCKGNPTNTRYQIYAIAFFIYGFVEYYKITFKNESLDYAIKLFESIEKYSFDNKLNGYFEAYSDKWILLEDLRLSDKDKNEPKTMNTHLHVLAAYSHLYTVYKDEKLKKALKNLITEVFINKILDKDKGIFNLFFDVDWTKKSTFNLFGIDIEGSWLLWEAACNLDDEEVKKLAKPLCLKIVDQCLRDGIDKDGGMMHLAENGVVGDTDKHWWGQAETVVGFMNAYQITKDEKYLNASLGCWEFIKNYVVDKKNGEWFGRINREHKVYEEELKIGPWKGPYHNSRMCMQIIQRVSSLIG